MMTDDEEFETQLRALKPAPAPAEMLETIGDRLERQRIWRRRGIEAAVATAAAACVLLAVVLMRDNEQPPHAAVIPTTHATTRKPDCGPSFWCYRQASNQSVEELDRLLELHAARGIGSSRILTIRVPASF